MFIEASILIDAPRGDVFDILTEYGQPSRMRINPALKSQSVVESDGNVFVCDNEWERDGRRIRQRRRYVVNRPDRIEEEVIGADRGLVRVVTTLEPEGDQTRLTMVSEYRFGGIWALLGRIAEGQLRQSDEGLLETLKTNIEAEFEEVEEP